MNIHINVRVSYSKLEINLIYIFKIIYIFVDYYNLIVYNNAKFEGRFYDGKKICK